MKNILLSSFLTFPWLVSCTKYEDLPQAQAAQPTATVHFKGRVVRFENLKTTYQETETTFTSDYTDEKGQRHYLKLCMAHGSRQPLTQGQPVYYVNIVSGADAGLNVLSTGPVTANFTPDGRYYSATVTGNVFSNNCQVETLRIELRNLNITVNGTKN